MKERLILAVIVLGSSLSNRGAKAKQVLDIVRAGGPEGAYMIQTRVGADDLVPHKDEDWEFEIIYTQHLGTDLVAWRGTEEAAKPEPPVRPLK